ncbi:hypothetical protein PISL3812_00055 [Talaromyces islandicus]|uniref:ER-bound oxygenase mpaB/mpaB'/Rubber oxygenase catalytic domain-containing protein n=1 Tax=Talaromyces islandicus TaxID=28573 RepID=A0A0U1LKS8_TALIS|nr:hypothetical protein PISL3812_00055 [Talaromyces islandicus]
MPMITPSIIVVGFTILIYVLWVRQVRYNRARKHARLLVESRALDTQEMPLLIAQRIYDSLMHAEFPFWFWKGIELALFRTYAIPTISSQLAKTSRLVAPETLPRRYVETEVLFLEFALRKWGTVPWLQAMARTRAIHAGYRKSGAVREEDMLFTLAALATQPVTLVEQLEWRRLNEAELCAIGTLYRAMADAFDIDYSTYLAPYVDKKPSTGLVGLDFYYALHSWQMAYEARAMTYTPQNRVLCDAAICLLLWGVPGASLRQFVTTALTTIMDDSLREAMGFPPTPVWIAKMTASLLDARRWLLRYLCPPRPDALKIQRWKDLDPSSIRCAFASEKTVSSKEVDPLLEPGSNCDAGQPSNSRDQIKQTPSTRMVSYVAAPYFVKPTVWNRWLSPGTWWWWAMGRPTPGAEEIHEPDGYSIPALGPPLGRTTAAQKREEEALLAVGLSKGWQYL